MTLLALMLAISVQRSLAGPPFFTDDPVPVDYQHWEFYLASIDSKRSDGWSGTAPLIELNYGVITNVQLHILAPLAYDAPADGAAHYGYGDTELGVKFRFIQETDHRPQVAVFPALEIPTGNSRENLGNGRPQGFLPVWAQKSWGPWTAGGGGGYGLNSGSGNQDWEFIGGVLQNQVRTNVLLGAEIYHQTAMQTGGRDDTAFNVGTIIDLSDQHHLLLSIGRSIDGPTDFQCYLAYQFTFDNSFFHWGNHRRP